MCILRERGKEGEIKWYCCCDYAALSNRSLRDSKKKGKFVCVCARGIIGEMRGKGVCNKEGEMKRRFSIG
jgi:hypothetical protein